MRSGYITLIKNNKYYTRRAHLIFFFSLRIVKMYIIYYTITMLYTRRAAFNGRQSWAVAYELQNLYFETSRRIYFMPQCFY